MAQHIPADQIEDKIVQRIVNTIRHNKYFKTSMRYADLPYEEYKETPTDEVYTCYRSVPAYLVTGGKATFEIHTEPREHGGRIATNIYMVA